MSTSHARCAGTTVLLLLAAAAGAGAQSSSDTTASPAAVQRTRPARVISAKQPWTVVYDHVDESMRLLDEDGREQASFAGRTLADGPVLRVPPDRPLDVRIENANPLLYAYEVTGPVVQERRARGCSAVLGTFAQAGLQFRALAVGGIPDDFSIEGSLREMMSAEALASRGELATRGEPMSAADRARTIALVSERVEGYELRARALAHFAASLGDSLRTIAELSDATGAGPLLDGLAQSMRSRLPGARRSADVPLALRALGAEAAQPATIIMQLAATGDADVREIRDRFDAALATIAGSYRMLQAQLYRVERYRAGVEQRWGLEASGDYRAVRITLAATPEFPEVPRYRLGTVEAVTNPAGRVSCTLAPGLALASTPLGFSTRNDTIVQSSSTEQRTAAALLLHLDWVGAKLPVGAIAGIGLGSNKRPDWYLGGSLRVSDVVRINAGAVWQREERLPDGLAVGMVLPEAARAGFEVRTFRYRPSLFWGASLIP